MKKKVISMVGAMTMTLQANAELEQQISHDYNEGNQSLEDNLSGGPSVVTLNKTVSLFSDNDLSGNVSPGDILRYNIDVVNATNVGASGMIFRDNLNTRTSLVTGSVDVGASGVVMTGNNANDSSVEVEFTAFNPGAVSFVSFDTVVNQVPRGIRLEINNQATLTSTNHPDTVSDDPLTADINDPTSISVFGAPLSVPTTSKTGLAALIAGVLSIFTLTYWRRKKQSIKL